MGTILTGQPKERRDSRDVASPPVPEHVGAPARTGLDLSRIGYAVGALVVIAGAAAILFTGALSPSAPAAPAKVAPANVAALPPGFGIDQGASPDMAPVNLDSANTTALPPMSNSMGMWDVVTVPQPALSAPSRPALDPAYWHFDTSIQQPLSALENDERYWDPNWIPLQPSVPAVTAASNDLAYWDENYPPYQALPAMTRDLGYADRIQPPASTVQCATKDSCREGIAVQSSDSALTLQCPTVLVTCQSSNGAQIPAQSTALPPMSNDMGYWDRIHPPTQPDPELSTNVGYGAFTTYPTFAP